MAPDASTQERIYRAIRRDLFEGTLPLRARLDIQAIGDRHMASTTPVREAMHRLIGEGLLEHHPDGGIRVFVPDESALRDLYAWSSHLLLTIVRVARAAILRRQIERVAARYLAGDRGAPQLAATLFESMALATDSQEILSQVTRTNERLHFARVAESLVLSDADRELNRILRNGRLDLKRITRIRIAGYHERRYVSAGIIYHQILAMMERQSKVG
jgi:DNA-binding GntR family transcriptional regulator